MIRIARKRLKRKIFCNFGRLRTVQSGPSVGLHGGVCRQNNHLRFAPKYFAFVDALFMPPRPVYIGLTPHPFPHLTYKNVLCNQ